LKEIGSIDGLFIRSLPMDSFLWNYLQTSSLVRKEFFCIFRMDHRNTSS
jgi:hypothetical protein